VHVASGGDRRRKKPTLKEIAESRPIKVEEVVTEAKGLWHTFKGYLGWSS
jgi:hypothetical protein